MSATTLLRCASCSSALKAEDLDLARGLAKCGYCQAVMTLAVPAASGAGFAPRPKVPLPPRVSVVRTESGVEIRRRWFTPAILALLGFCVVWDGFLVVWSSVVFAERGPVRMARFPLLHVAAGVGLTFLALAGLLNTTYITIGRGRLAVRHGPLPWAGKREIERDRIEQLFCKQRTRRGEGATTTQYRNCQGVRRALHVRYVRCLKTRERPGAVDSSGQSR